MPMTARFLALAALGAAFLTAPLGAAAATFELDSSAVIDLAQGCSSPCLTGVTFALPVDAVGVPIGASLSGTISIDTSTPGAPELTFSLVAAFALLTPTGAEDNGVARIDFGMQYNTDATGPLFPTPVGANDFLIALPQASGIFGIQTQRDAAGNPVNATPAAFNDPDVATTLYCSLTTDLTCIITFAGFTLDVGTPTATTLYFRNQADFTAAQVVPEPGTAALLAGALAGLLALRRLA